MDKAVLDEQINKALEAHALWKTRLQEAINSGTSQYSVEGLRVTNQCDFGRWLYFEIDPSSQNSEHYEKVRDLHQAFHQEAANILELALSGKKQDAMVLLGPNGLYESLSSGLIVAMKHWRDVV